MIEDRTKMVINGSIEANTWEANGRHITPYSARHYYATQALMRKVDIYDLSVNMGTGIDKIQRTYSHITAEMKADELTKDQAAYESKRNWEERLEKGDPLAKKVLEAGAKHFDSMDRLNKRSDKRTPDA